MDQDVGHVEMELSNLYFFLGFSFTRNGEHITLCWYT